MEGDRLSVHAHQYKNVSVLLVRAGKWMVFAVIMLTLQAAQRRQVSV